MVLYTQYASGRAECQICGKIIAKDEMDVVFKGYHTEKHHHYTCIQSQVRNLQRQVIESKYKEMWEYGRVQQEVQRI